jgi:hypothetical protein
VAAELKPVLQMLVDEIQAVDVRISELDRRMKDAARANEACRRLREPLNKSVSTRPRDDL